MKEHKVTAGKMWIKIRGTPKNKRRKKYKKPEVTTLPDNESGPGYVIADVGRNAAEDEILKHCSDKAVKEIQAEEDKRIMDAITNPKTLTEIYYGRTEPKEMVDHPAHYGGKDNPYEAIKVIEAWGLGFHLGSCVKYIARLGKKGDVLEDAKKSLWYLKRYVENLEKAK